MVRGCRMILPRVKPFYICTISVVHFEGKLCAKPNYDDILAKNTTVPRVGKILWESFVRRKKQPTEESALALTKEHSPGRQPEGTTWAADSTATNQGCVLGPWHSVHMPSPLSMIQAIWATYCFSSSCASLKFFLECPFQSQVLSCPEAKIVKLSVAGLSECVLRASPPAAVPELAHLPRPERLPRLPQRGEWALVHLFLLLIWSPPNHLRLLSARFQFGFYAIAFKGGQSLWICFQMCSFLRHF